MEMEASASASASADAVPRLPNDAIVEILTYLPAKSLLKFRCVCKSWFSLISSRQFAKSHLLKSKHQSTFSSHRIILNCRGNFKHCSLESILCDPVIDALDTDYPLRCAEKFVWIVGSCDGLICLVINKQNLILWNPTTRICKKLPDFGVETKYTTYVTYGLGFDKSSDDYKLAAFFTRKGELPEVIVKVYSLKSDEWKSLENYKGRQLMADTAAFAHGKLYWTSTAGSELELELALGWEIVSLDLETEEYGMVQMPSYVKSGDYSRLGVSEGRLYVLCCHAMSADVWIMDYGQPGSWTKVVSVPYNDDYMRYTYKMALCVVMEKGEVQVVLHCGDKFVIFDSKNCSFRYPELRNLNKHAAPTAYIQSLVSPIHGN